MDINNVIKNTDLSYINKSIQSSNTDELTTLIEMVEKKLSSGTEYLSENLFTSIENTLNLKIENIGYYDEYEKLNYLLKKVEWLKMKNIRREYYIKEDMLFEKIVEAAPSLKNQLITLMDLENERETKTITLISQNKMQYISLA